ncbi:hypothetical protein RYX36_021257 [Vicia faba]
MVTKFIVYANKRKKIWELYESPSLVFFLCPSPGLGPESFISPTNLCPTPRDGPSPFNVLNTPFTSPMALSLPCNGLSNGLASDTLGAKDTKKKTIRIKVRNVREDLSFASIMLNENKSLFIWSCIA